MDTACSASLVAAALAYDALTRGGSASSGTAGGGGRLRAAAVAGVHVQATPTSSAYVWNAGMLSPAGRCQVLDSAADGYVRGEALQVGRG